MIPFWSKSPLSNLPLHSTNDPPVTDEVDAWRPSRAGPQNSDIEREIDVFVFLAPFFPVYALPKLAECFHTGL